MDLSRVQLRHEPCRVSRNRKILPGLAPPWEHVPPVWELHIRKYRVFYDVDRAENLVLIRAIRIKPLHRTTEENL
ncbi:MAG: type II toxin-antitoxin system RelE/ParE family toxin [Candidatus Hydrogenedentes bacterium]|nr:type II toxin-antitoxin system RelE/ParE family toxin [Candidatus Hydrogenedentota bacterium]